MRKRSRTVRQIANEAGLDVELTLLSIWDAGIPDEPDGPDSVIASRYWDKVNSAVGITNQNVRSIAYWADIFEMAEPDFRDYLTSNGVAVTPNTRNLPKGAVSKVKLLSSGRNLRQPPEPETRADEPIEWRIVGRQRDIAYLSVDEVSGIHEYLTKLFSTTSDPIFPPGVRDPNLLASAVLRAHTSLGTTLKYPTIEMAGAALLHSLTLNHAFHNGNKRTALVASLVFLSNNNLTLTASERDVLRFMVRIANHGLGISAKNSDRSDQETIKIAEWIFDYSRPLTSGDKRMKFRDLQAVLRRFDCDIQRKEGNRVDIIREIEGRGILGRSRSLVLRTKISSRNDGSDVDKATIAKIRTDLRLTEEYGCDSSAFYDSRINVIDEEIARYQNTLKRLAKL